MLAEFDATLRNKFRIDVWCEKDSKVSAVNSKYYVYKGETIAEITGDTSTVAGTEIYATTGNASLSMYPNGESMAVISYNAGDKALRISAEDENSWNFDASRTSPNSDGYWLITASTKGYKNVTLSLDQSSTSKGPRDWCISYSLDNSAYTTLQRSNVRISENLSSSYTNIRLPKELDDKETVYIKIKIDGGENVGAAELLAVDDPETAEDEGMVGKGNTAINDIEICGNKIENKLDIEAFSDKLKKGKTYHINVASNVDNPALIIAGYDINNRLISLDLNTTGLTVPEDSAVTSVKAMSWEDFHSVKPLSPYADKAVE